MKIAIVGNGLVDARFFEQIEQADFIVRFNSPPATNVYAGMRTDQLVISNSSKQTQDLLTNSSYLEGSVFVGARSILLPYHPEIIRKYMPKPNIFSFLKGRRSDLTDFCRKTAQAKSKSVDILDAFTYLEACERLGISTVKMRSAFPSSGILAILHHQKQSPSAHTCLFGFGFTGWKRHDWSSEKLYVKKLIQEGHISSCV